VKRLLMAPPDGRPRIKPLVKYLNENFWRDVRKLAPRLTGQDEVWLEPALRTGFELFRELDPAWFREAFLAPELREQTDFLPLAGAFMAGKRDVAKDIFDRLRTRPAHAPDKNLTFHILRHRLKTLVHPLARRSRSRLRELEVGAARRLAAGGGRMQA
jgi:hypothetical protein